MIALLVFAFWSRMRSLYRGIMTPPPGRMPFWQDLWFSLRSLLKRFLLYIGWYTQPKIVYTQPPPMHLVRAGGWIPALAGGQAAQAAAVGYSPLRAMASVMATLMLAAARAWFHESNRGAELSSSSLSLSQQDLQARLEHALSQPGMSVDRYPCTCRVGIS